jgi:multifunctional methyltransferase subunit TRM112
MKLLTYNLSSHVLGMGMHVFYLCLQATEILINPVDFNCDFLAQMIPKVKWTVFVQAADTSILAEILKEPTESYKQEEIFLWKMLPRVA